MFRIKKIDDPQTLRELKEALDEGCNIPMACMQVGISRQQFAIWMMDGERIAEEGTITSNEAQKRYNFYREMGPKIVEKVKILFDRMDKAGAKEASVILKIIERFWPREIVDYRPAIQDKEETKKIPNQKEIFQIIVNTMSNDSLMRVLLRNDEDGKLEKSIRNALGSESGSRDFGISAILPEEPDDYP